jgi:hypothetical protein
VTTQTRAMSFVEAMVNVVAGYGLAILAQMILFPLFDMQLSFGDNLLIAALFTTISLGRGYLIRRLFEALRTRLH